LNAVGVEDDPADVLGAAAGRDGHLDRLARQLGVRM
jgi:hypothetical protein